MTRKQYDQAIDSFRKAIELNPASAVSYNNLALALSETGQLEEAIRASRTAVQLKPNDAGGWNSLGNLLAQQGEYKESSDRLSTSDSAQARLCARALESVIYSPSPRRLRNRLGRARMAKENQHRIPATGVRAAGMGWKRIKRPNDPHPRRAGIWRHDSVCALCANGRIPRRTRGVAMSNRTGVADAPLAGNCRDHQRRRPPKLRLPLSTAKPARGFPNPSRYDSSRNAISEIPTGIGNQMGVPFSITAHTNFVSASSGPAIPGGSSTASDPCDWSNFRRSQPCPAYNSTACKKAKQPNKPPPPRVIWN